MANEVITVRVLSSDGSRVLYEFSTIGDETGVLVNFPAGYGSKILFESLPDIYRNAWFEHSKLSAGIRIGTLESNIVTELENEEFYESIDFFVVEDAEEPEEPEETPITIEEKLITIAENAPKVYEAGKKAEYDAFWDAFQDYGNRTDYKYAFANSVWDEDLFSSIKYKDIRCTSIEGIFWDANIPVDLPEYLAKNGITLTLVNCAVYSMTRTFRSSKFTRIGVIDVTSAVSGYCQFSETFQSCTALKTIDKIVLNNGTDTWYSTAFSGCQALENLIIEGVIGNNGFNVQWSTKLSHDSIVSIINALSTTTTGLAITLSKTAVNNAFETSEGAEDGSSSAEWVALKNTKTNWTINLT